MKNCVWEEEPDDGMVHFAFDIWNTGCGENFYGDSPIESLGFKYCPYCGGNLVAGDEHERSL